MKLNEKIYYCRKKAGLSQLDLADRLGVSRQSVSKWETGEANPEVTKIPAMAKLFGVTADWLLSEEEPQEAAPQEAHAPSQAYPEWVEKLPTHMVRMVKQFGWLYGVRLAVSGGMFTVFGILARILFKKMIFGFSSTPFGGMEFGYDPFSEFNNAAWSIFGTFTGFIIGIGLVILILGVILAVSLKKWGQKD